MNIIDIKNLSTFEDIDIQPNTLLTGKVANPDGISFDDRFIYILSIEDVSGPSYDFIKWVKWAKFDELELFDHNIRHFSGPYVNELDSFKEDVLSEFYSAEEYENNSFPGE